MTPNDAPAPFMNFKRAAVILSLFVTHTLLGVAAPILDVRTIAGKDPAEVTKVLGEPCQQEKTKQGPKLSYRGGKIEVVFINDKADWITISDMSGVSFDDDAIKALGLKPERPTFKGTFVIRWEPHTTYRSVSVFAHNGKTDYAYIKVITK